jgi:magnesium chelatase family protein
MLVASMNPSPSGYFPDDPNNTSSTFEMQRYMNKISGPLLDRIDIHIEVDKVDFEQLSDKRKEKPALKFVNGLFRHERFSPIDSIP